MPPKLTTIQTILHKGRLLTSKTCISCFHAQSVFCVGRPKLFFSQNTKFSFKHANCIALVVQKSLHFLLVPVRDYAVEDGHILKLWSYNSVSGGRYVHMKKEEENGDVIN